MVLEGFCQKNCVNGLTKEEAQSVRDIPLIEESIDGINSHIGNMQSDIEDLQLASINFADHFDTLDGKVRNLESSVEYVDQQIEKIPEIASFYLYDNVDWGDLFDSANDRLKTDVLISFELQTHYNHVGSSYLSTDIETISFIIPKATQKVSNKIVLNPKTYNLNVTGDDSDNFHFVTAFIPTFEIDTVNATFNLTVISKMIGKETDTTSVTYNTTSYLVSYYESQTVTFTKQITTNPTQNVLNFRLYTRGVVE